MNAVLINSNKPVMLQDQLNLSYFRPYTHPRLGPFDCLLGQWYWQITGARVDEFRQLSGDAVVLLAASLKPIYTANVALLTSFREGIYVSIKSNRGLRELFNTTPEVYFEEALDTRWVAYNAEEDLWTDPSRQYLSILIDARRHHQIQ